MNKRQLRAKARKKLPFFAALSGNRCYLCGELFENINNPPLKGPKRPTLDHIIPKSYGGQYSEENIRIAHASCNSLRGNRPLIYYRMFCLFRQRYPQFAVEIHTSVWLYIQKLNRSKSRNKCLVNVNSYEDNRNIFMNKKWTYERLLDNIQDIQALYFDKSSKAFLGKFKEDAETENDVRTVLWKDRQKQIDDLFVLSGWTRKEFDEESEKRLRLVSDIF